MSWSERQQLLSTENPIWCLCQEHVSRKKEIVLHNCHYPGQVYGIAHSRCNLKARRSKLLPVFFHNLARYDAHHIFKNLQLAANEKLSAISRTDETYTSFSITVKTGEYKNKFNVKVPLYSHIRFLDSFQFMSQVLDNLAKTLQHENFKLSREAFGNLNDDEFNSVIRKGFFPYNYLDSFQNFSAPFPAFGPDWKNMLSRKIEISEKHYTQALAMYNLFACKDFGDYHDLYLRIDVFILADVFETFRNVRLKVYNLDSAHFFSAPNLSWNAILITTSAEIGLLTDIEMLLFCERAIRGGVNGIGALRHFKANNPDTNDYNANEPKYGAIFDVTSLYAGTMQQSLPMGVYTWRADLTIDDILNAEPMGEFGFFVEVDLMYPKELHHSHNDLPLAPEQLAIQPEEISPYAKSFNIRPCAVEKLVETLFDKRLYVCHFCNLQFYHQQGLKVDKLHRSHNSSRAIG